MKYLNLLKNKSYEIVLGLVGLLSLFARIYRLNDWNFGFNYDLSLKAWDAWTASQGGWKLFYYVPDGGREGLYINIIGLFFKLFGPGVLQFRAPAVIINLFTLVIFYLILKKIIKNRWIVLFTLAIFSFLPWNLGLARMGWRTILVPLLTGLVLYFILLLRDNSNKKHIYFYLFGICVFLVMGLNSYFSFVIFLPVVPLLFWHYNIKITTHEKKFAAVSLLTLTGLLFFGYFLQKDFNLDRILVLAKVNMAPAGVSWWVFMSQQFVIRIASVFSAVMWYRPPISVEYFGGYPIINPLLCATTMTGIMLGGMKKSRKYFPFFVWIIFATFPVVFSSETFNLLRFTPGMIPLFIVVAMGTDDLISTVFNRRQRLLSVGLVMLALVWQMTAPIYLYSPAYQTDNRIRDDYYYNQRSGRDLVEMVNNDYTLDLMGDCSKITGRYYIIRWWYFMNGFPIERINTDDSIFENGYNTSKLNYDILCYYGLSYLKPIGEPTIVDFGLISYPLDSSQLTVSMAKEKIASKNLNYRYISAKNKYGLSIDLFVKPNIYNDIINRLNRYGYFLVE